MIYPCLVPKLLCKTEIEMEIYREGINEYGEPMVALQYKGMCNFQDKARTVMTSDKKLVEITGTALFPGDICPELATISCGTATVFGIKRSIVQGRKSRNPDGSVNYTEVYIQ